MHCNMFYIEYKLSLKKCTDADIISIYRKTHMQSCPMILPLGRHGPQIKERAERWGEAEICKGFWIQFKGHLGDHEFVYIIENR